MDLSPNSPGIACLNDDRKTLSFLYLDQQWSASTPQSTRMSEIKVPPPSLWIKGHRVDHIHFYRVASEPRPPIPLVVKGKKRKRDENVEAIRLVHETTRLLDTLKLCVDFAHPQHIQVMIESYTYHQTDKSARQDLIHHQGGAIRTNLAMARIHFELVSNQTIKAKFGGHGKTDKHGMWQASTSQYPQVIDAIEHHFGFSYKDFVRKYELGYQQRLKKWRTQLIQTASQPPRNKTKTTTTAFDSKSILENDADADDLQAIHETRLPAEPKYKLPLLPSPLSDLNDAFGILVHMTPSISSNRKEVRPKAT
jgi:hypothetical protein